MCTSFWGFDKEKLMDPAYCGHKFRIYGREVIAFSSLFLSLSLSLSLSVCEFFTKNQNFTRQCVLFILYTFEYIFARATRQKENTWLFERVYSMTLEDLKKKIPVSTTRYVHVKCLTIEKNIRGSHLNESPCIIIYIYI